MFPIRHAAVRLLTSRSSTIVARPRTFTPLTSFTSSPSKAIRSIPSIHFQRRWASNEAEAKQEDGAPVESEDSKPAIAETANATEATEDVTTSAAEADEVAEKIDTTVGAASARPGEGARRPFDTGYQAGGGDRRAPLRDPPTPKPTVYVGNLFFDITENDLAKEFGRFGSIKKTRVIRDARGLSKGFGYVQFETVEEASKAIDELNQQLFEGRRLMVSYAVVNEGDRPQRQDRDSGPVNPPSKTLFIGNMSFEMTDKDLNALFRGIRNVIDVRVAIDRRTGQPRGFAHADFVDTKSAMDAVKILAEKENYGRKLRIDYSYGPSTAPRNNPR